MRFNQKQYAVYVVIGLLFMFLLVVSTAAGADSEFDEFEGANTKTTSEEADTKKRRKFNRFSILSTLFDRLGFTKMQKVYAIIVMLIFLFLRGVRPGNRARLPWTRNKKQPKKETPSAKKKKKGSKSTEKKE